MNPFEGLPDEKLMDYYQKGESLAFEVLYQRHKAKVYGYLRRRMPNSSDVAEVFQNVFMKVHKSRKQYDRSYTLAQWLFTITRSELLDYAKKKRVKTVSLEENMSHEEQVAVARELELDLDQVDLTAREQKLIDLRFFSDMDYDEISEQLNVSQANARKILSRALAKIRKSMMRKGAK